MEVLDQAGREADDAKRLLMTQMVRNGGTKTFLKAGVPERLLLMFSEMAQRGEVEQVTETRQTVTYRTREHSISEGDV